MLTKPWEVEHNIAHSVFMLCSAALVILVNQLTVTCLALYDVIGMKGRKMTSLDLNAMSRVIDILTLNCVNIQNISDSL